MKKEFKSLEEPTNQKMDEAILAQVLPELEKKRLAYEGVHRRRLLWGFFSGLSLAGLAGISLFWQRSQNEKSYEVAEEMADLDIGSEELSLAELDEDYELLVAWDEFAEVEEYL